MTHGYLLIFFAFTLLFVEMRENCVCVCECVPWFSSMIDILVEIHDWRSSFVIFQSSNENILPKENGLYSLLLVITYKKASC